MSSRRSALETSLRHAMRVGVNVVAFATGREFMTNSTCHSKRRRIRRKRTARRPERRTKSSGGCCRWPNCGTPATGTRLPEPCTTCWWRSTRPPACWPRPGSVTSFPVTDNLPAYPMVYLHGRSAFQFSRQEIENLRKYLNGGAVLFADACCGSPLFDQSVRNLVRELFPKQNLERIPITHELFSQGIGFDLRKVKERFPESGKTHRPPGFRVSGGRAIPGGRSDQGALLRDLQQVRPELRHRAARVSGLCRL